MGKYYRILVLMLGMVVLLAGCGAQELNLTEEEEQKIVGYSADLLLKYDTNHSGSLVDTTEARELAAKVAALEERRQEEATVEEDASSEGEETQTADEGAPAGTQSIAEAFGVPGFEISYSGHETCSTYPNDGTTDEFFNMAATMGNELIVYHFDIRNPSDTDMICDIFDNDPIIRMIINGNERENALTTLLLDDIATINQTVAAGETVGAVVVLEVPEGYSAQAETSSILIRRGEEQSIIPLQ